MSESPFTRDTGMSTRTRNPGYSVNSKSTDWLATLDQGLFKSDSTNGVQRPALIGIGGLMFAALLLLFAGKLFSMQVSAGNQYYDLANGNRIRETILYAERGDILDRAGEVLASNVAGYQVRINPYQLPEEDSARQQVYETIARYLSISAESVKDKAESEGLDYVLPIAVGKSLGQDKALRLETELVGMSGVSLDVVPQREYVRGAGLAHTLGYTSLVNRQDLEARPELSLVDYVGRAGIEQQYDSLLRGENGYQRFEVDARGQPLRLLASKQPSRGKDIYLTIDAGLQRELYAQLNKSLNELGKQRASGVFVGPETGDVLAMVSLPDYDNNLFSGGISSDNYRRLLDDPNQPLYNKVVSGVYPTGSIIKPLIASAGLQEGTIDINTTVVDRGSITVRSAYSSEGYTFYSWNRAGLGPVNVERAIAVSSNIFFYSVGGGFEHVKGLGPDTLAKYYRVYGLGESPGLDLPSQSNGIVPDPAWKEEVSGQPWVLGDTYHIAIGQGDLRASPLQMALATNAVATGKLMQPRLFLHAENEPAAEPVVKRRLPISQENLNIVRSGMSQVIYNGANCSCIFTDVPVKFAGKTGTAQNKVFRTDKTPNHAWFTSYAPFDRPEIGSTILIEEGETSSKAVPPAVQSMKYYFNR